MDFLAVMFFIDFPSITRVDPVVYIRVVKKAKEIKAKSYE
jgi:hypothetical protein